MVIKEGQSQDDFIIELLADKAQDDELLDCVCAANKSFSDFNDKQRLQIKELNEKLKQHRQYVLDSSDRIKELEEQIVILGKMYENEGKRANRFELIAKTQMQIISNIINRGIKDDVDKGTD